jgi:dienelactone hydrolase
MTIQPGKAAHSLLARGLFLLILFAAARGALAGGQTLREVVFTDYGQLATNAELARRLLSPLAAARLEAQLAQAGTTATGNSINLADERFVVYVPAQRPPQGYGCLVFVPPWQDARIPSGWAAALEKYGVIFVSAARSGNTEVVGRREPLALLAAENLTRRYPIDPGRIYIGGFSGGSRIAQRLALAYPDVFRGAILNAGSDPIGEVDLPVPPGELLSKFQSATHVVYLTGDQDTAQTLADQVSVHTMHQWCVSAVDSYVIPRLAHEVAPPEALSWALGRLRSDAPPEPARLAACQAKIETELTTRLQEVRALIDAGHRTEAEKLLQKVDAQFGGLAAPRSLELARLLQMPP